VFALFIATVQHQVYYKLNARYFSLIPVLESKAGMVSEHFNNCYLTSTYLIIKVGDAIYETNTIEELVQSVMVLVDILSNGKFSHLGRLEKYYDIVYQQFN
jgi:hypothetical protein